MRISDWSSDVCSSDLPDAVGFAHQIVRLGTVGKVEPVLEAGTSAPLDRKPQHRGPGLLRGDRGNALGRGRRKGWTFAHRPDKVGRSEARRVGQEGVSTGCERGSAWY